MYMNGHEDAPEVLAARDFESQMQYEFPNDEHDPQTVIGNDDGDPDEYFDENGGLTAEAYEYLGNIDSQGGFV